MLLPEKEQVRKDASSSTISLPLIFISRPIIRRQSLHGKIFFSPSVSHPPPPPLLPLDATLLLFLLSDPSPHLSISMSASPNSNVVVAEQQEEQPHQVDLPPPLASASSSPSKIALPLPTPSSIWPFSDPSLVFFMDPFSPKVDALRNTLEVSRTQGKRREGGNVELELNPFPPFLPTTPLVLQASHIVLDSSCKENHFFRSLPPPQHVVSLGWLKDSFFEEIGLPEGDSSLPVEEAVEMKEEGPEEEEEDEDDEAFAHQTSGYAASHARGS